MSVANMVSLGNDDLTTAHNVSAGSKLFKKSVRGNVAYSIHIIWSGVDVFDGTVTIQGSNTNVDADFADYLTPNKIAIDAASGSKILTGRFFSLENIGLNYISGTATSGTIKILLKETRG